MNTRRGSIKRCFFLCILLAFTVNFATSRTISDRSRDAYRKLSCANRIESVGLLNDLTLYCMFDSLDRAGQLAAKAVAISPYGEALAKSLVLQAMVLTSMNMPDSALGVLQQANSIYHKLNIKKGLAQYYLCMGRVMVLKKLRSEAISFFLKAKDAGIKEAEYYIAGRSYLGLAECNRQPGRKKEYVDLLGKAESYLHKSTDSVFTGQALLGLGIHYLDLGMQEKANHQIFVALRMLENTADSLFLGYAYVNIASLYKIPGEDKPDSYYRKALAIFRALKNDKAIAYALNQRGLWHLSNKDYARAIPAFIESADLKVRASDWQGACFAYGNLVDIYSKLNNRNKAMEALKNCRQMAGKSDDNLSQAVYMQAAGIWHLAVRNYNKAIHCFKGSLTIARKIPVESLVIENLKSLSETYQAKGDASTALKYFKDYTNAQDSLKKVSDIEAIANIQLLYEAENKDKLIHQLKDSVEDREKNQAYLIANLIALSFVLLIVLAIKIYNKQKTSSLKRMQNQEKASRVILSGEQQNTLWTQLNELLYKEKLYLQNDLSLAELSKRLNTNTTYLSKVINDIHGENFSQLLNHYRVDEASRLLAGQHARNMTIEGIARMAGFNSKSAFNTAFKKIHSVTPSEYLALKSEENEQIQKTASCSDL